MCFKNFPYPPIHSSIISTSSSKFHPFPMYLLQHHSMVTFAGANAGEVGTTGRNKRSRRRPKPARRTPALCVLGAIRGEDALDAGMGQNFIRWPADFVIAYHQPSNFTDTFFLLIPMYEYIKAWLFGWKKWA